MASYLTLRIILVIAAFFCLCWAKLDPNKEKKGPSLYVWCSHLRMAIKKTLIILLLQLSDNLLPFLKYSSIIPLVRMLATKWAVCSDVWKFHTSVACAGWPVKDFLTFPYIRKIIWITSFMKNLFPRHSSYSSMIKQADA